MDQESIRDRILAKFGEDVVVKCDPFRDQMSVTVRKDHVVKVCRFLKEDRDLAFDYLSFVGGVDWQPKEPRFEIVYQLYSMRYNHQIRLKAGVEEEADGRGSIDSVVGVWPTADWHERETAEMFGLTFNNHPDPRKLLLPEHWTVYPLRKDFPLEGTEEDTPDLPTS